MYISYMGKGIKDLTNIFIKCGWLYALSQIYCSTDCTFLSNYLLKEGRTVSVALYKSNARLAWGLI